MQGHVAESQTHRCAEAEPDGAAQERQRERAVTRDARDGLVLFDRGRKKFVINVFFTLRKDFVLIGLFNPHCLTRKTSCNYFVQ